MWFECLTDLLMCECARCCLNVVCVFKEQQRQQKKCRDAASSADDQMVTEPFIPNIDLFLLVADLLILNK